MKIVNNNNNKNTDFNFWQYKAMYLWNCVKNLFDYWNRIDERMEMKIVNNNNDKNTNFNFW